MICAARKPRRCTPPGTRPPGCAREKHTVLAALARHAGLATADPETETAKDVWELAVFGLPGRLSFTAICQPWLRETVKRWAADELPRHRGAGAGRVVRALVGSVAHLSRSLRGSRPDHGDRPTALGRRDIESFLHRLAYLAATGQISPELRAKICRDVKRVLGRDPGARADPPRRPRPRSGQRLHPGLRRRPGRARTR